MPLEITGCDGFNVSVLLSQYSTMIILNQLQVNNNVTTIFCVAFLFLRNIQNNIIGGALEEPRTVSEDRVVNSWSSRNVGPMVNCF